MIKLNHLLKQSIKLLSLQKFLSKVKMIGHLIYLKLWLTAYSNKCKEDLISRQGLMITQFNILLREIIFSSNFKIT